MSDTHLEAYHRLGSIIAKKRGRRGPVVIRRGKGVGDCGRRGAPAGMMLA